MIEYKTEGGNKFRLEVNLTDCTCEACDGLRASGHKTYDSIVYLGEMMIGFDCGACSEEDAFDKAEVLVQMFALGELGSNPQRCFSPEAIIHVRMR